MSYAKPILHVLDLTTERASCCIYTWVGVNVTPLCGSGLPGSNPIVVPNPVPVVDCVGGSVICRAITG